jgi:hypothetical protein
MDEVFSRYLDPAFRYVRSQSPARVRSRDDALRDGLNWPWNWSGTRRTSSRSRTQSGCGQETSSGSAWTARA